MSRTYLVTGAASGIGKATVEYLRAHGHTAIGADIRDADIVADLSTPEGRSTLVDAATAASDGRLDGVIAVAGLVIPQPVTVAVNHFGAVATLEGLRPLLQKSDAPRAAVVSSLATLEEIDDRLLELIESGDEAATLAYAETLAGDASASGSSVFYQTSKRSIARWVRRNAPTPAWAGTGIALNAIAPGVIETPMTKPALETAEGRAALDAGAPAPYNGPAAPPIAAASLLAWLTSEENVYVTGQVIFIDGGAEAIRRPEQV